MCGSWVDEFWRVRSVVRRRVAWMLVEAVGLEFLLCRFFVGVGRGHPRLRTGNGGNAMSGGMCGDDHRHWLGTTGRASADRRYAQGPRWGSGP